MMNRDELTEYTNLLLDTYVVTLFDEEGEVGDYTKDKADELVDYIFDVEQSAIALTKDGKRAGSMQLVMDYSERKGGTYIEISDYTDNDEMEKLFAKAEKYYPQ